LQIFEVNGTAIRALENPKDYPVSTLLNVSESENNGYEILLDPNITYTADEYTYFRGYKVIGGERYILNRVQQTNLTFGFKATVIGEIDGCGSGENNGEMKQLHIFHVDESSKSCFETGHDEVLNHYLCDSTPLESHKHDVEEEENSVNPAVVAIISVIVTLAVVGVAMGGYFYVTKSKSSDEAKEDTKVAVAVPEQKAIEKAQEGIVKAEKDEV